MSKKEEMIKAIETFAPKIKGNYVFYIGETIPSRPFNKALNSFASGANKNAVIGFCDTSLFSTGKEGYLFTDKKIYYKEMMEKSNVLSYDNIKSVSVINHGKSDTENYLSIKLVNGLNVKFSSFSVYKTPLKDLIDRLVEIDNSDETATETSINLKDSKISYGSSASGFGIGNYGQVNKMYDEEKFHAVQGHGFAAERANNLYDKLTGHDAKIVGDNNAKNGADRIVDGVSIQSKYYQTGRECVNSCFDKNGNFKYLLNGETGKPMQIEVPSDKYEEALACMKEKIANGKVPGVSDPNEAENIIRKGHFTYKQVKNIAKAGTVESITYDAVNGAIIGASTFGITATLTFATSLWNGESFENSIKLATYQGLKVGGTAFATTIIGGYLSRAGLNSALVGSSEAIISVMGPKASQVLINAFRSMKNLSPIYGAAAMKSAAKLLRGNAITGVATVVVMSSVDVVNIFRGRISGKQLFKNITNTATTVAGGTGGWIGGAALGSAILPGVGTIIGGLIGSFAAGSLASKATNKVLDQFIEDDADEMVEIIEKQFEILAVDYLLNQEEAERIVGKLSGILDGKELKNMFASINRKQYADNLLIPLIESEVKERAFIQAISDDQMIFGLRSVLEEMSDEAGEEVFA